MVASLAPVGHQAIHYKMPDTIGAVERRHISAVLGDLGLGKALGRGQSSSLLVIVRGGSQNQHAVDIDLLRARKPGPALQRSGLLHAAPRRWSPARPPA